MLGTCLESGDPAAGTGGGSPVEQHKDKAATTHTKGKWLKITRKGLLITAMSRVGKQQKKTDIHKQTKNPLR